MLSKKVLEEKVERYQKLEVMYKEIEAEMASIKESLTKEMGRRNVEELAVGNNIVRYTYYVQSRFDSTAFKKANPAEYAAYQKQVEGHRFSVA